jgi:hypothetical protein
MAIAKKPRLSANKMGEYLVVGPTRRRRIIYDAKFPSDAVVPYYQPAGDAIAQFIAGGMTDFGILEKQADTLGKTNPTTIWQQRRLLGNMEAIDTFLDITDDIDLKGLTTSLGAHSAPRIAYNGLEVNVRPEIIVESKAGGGTVGAIKLHFPKTNSLNEQAAGYVSAMLHAFCTQHMPDKGAANSKLCTVIDVGSGKVFKGPASAKSRMRDVAAACGEVASLWPSIQP